MVLQWHLVVVHVAGGQLVIVHVAGGQLGRQEINISWLGDCLEDLLSWGMFCVLTALEPEPG